MSKERRNSNRKIESRNKKTEDKDTTNSIKSSRQQKEKQIYGWFLEHEETNEQNFSSEPKDSSGSPAPY